MCRFSEPTLLAGHQLPAVEGLRVPGGRCALYPAQAHHGKKGVLGKPVPVRLGLEESAQILDLLPAEILVQPDEEVGDTEVAVILGNLVLQDQMTPEGIPGQIG